MNSFSKTDLTGEMLAQTEAIYQNNLAISRAQTAQERHETDLERLTAAVYEAILHERHPSNDKLKYTNDEMRKAALLRQTDLSAEIKSLKSARLAEIETQNALRADTERRRKTFRVAELNLLWAIENGEPPNAAAS